MAEESDDPCKEKCLPMRTSRSYRATRYLPVFMILAVLGALSGCDRLLSEQQRICQTRDTSWSDCIGERAYGNQSRTYAGNWEDNVPNGLGTQYWPDGRIDYLGEWKDGKRHGRGTLYNDDGSFNRRGWWCNDTESDGPCRRDVGNPARESVTAKTAEILAMPPPPKKKVAPSPQPVQVVAPSLQSDEYYLAIAVRGCYPSASRRLNEEGRVVVAVTIGTDGRLPRGVADLQVTESSGFSRLDRAAECVLRQLTFNPGTRNGQPIEARATLPITFRLESTKVVAPSLKSSPRSQASALNSCYPSASRRLNEEGRVVVVVTIGTGGKMVSMQVSRSSGFRRLDDAAECVLRKLTFNPGTRDGQAVEALATMPITFRLE